MCLTRWTGFPAAGSILGCARRWWEIGGPPPRCHFMTHTSPVMKHTRPAGVELIGSRNSAGTSLSICTKSSLFQVRRVWKSIAILIPIE